MVERILEDFGKAYSLMSIALRYFNAAGADPAGEIGEDHDPETHLIPLVLDAAAGSRPDITILGNDYDTPDGTCIRDYIHVSDIANAHVLALNNLREDHHCKAYNLGTGVGVSVSGVIEAASRITGRDIAVRHGNRRPGDPAVLLADPTQARTQLGWTPAHSTIDEMIATAWSWRLKHV